MTVEDSIKIYTYQFKPTGENRANIFLIHGAGGNVSKYRNLIKPLTDNGFAVYALDWRGYGKSTGVPNYKGVMKDTEIAFENFISKTAKDSLKTIVYGMSLGGPMAIKITKDNQNQVNLLVLDGTVESAQSLAIDYAPIEFLKENVRKSPEEFNQDYVGVRDIAEIKNIPKLIIHSRMDRDIPFIRGKNRLVLILIINIFALLVTRKLSSPCASAFSVMSKVTPNFEPLPGSVSLNSTNYPRAFPTISPLRS